MHDQTYVTPKRSARDFFVTLVDGSLWCAECGVQLSKTSDLWRHLDSNRHQQNLQRVQHPAEKLHAPPAVEALPVFALDNFVDDFDVDAAAASSGTHSVGSDGNEPVSPHPPPLEPPSDGAHGPWDIPDSVMPVPSPEVLAQLGDANSDTDEDLPDAHTAAKHSMNPGLDDLAEEYDDSGDARDLDVTWEQLHEFAEYAIAVGELRLRGGAETDVEKDAQSLLDAALKHGLRTDDLAAAVAVTASLKEAMRQVAEEQQSDDLPSPREKTVRWYLQRADSPIAEGCTMTVLQACYAMAWLKLRGGMTGECLDTLCSLLSVCGMLTDENVMPRSEYLVRGVLNLQRPFDNEYEMCSNGQCPHVYGPALLPDKRREHKGERCLDCGRLRYLSRNALVQPVRSAFVLKLEDVVNHLFGEPVFAQFAGTRTRAMLDSPVYRRVDAAHGFAISALAAGMGEGGAAEVQESDGFLAASDIEDDADIGCWEEAVNPDPIDEVMTGEGDQITLMFAIFIDGVQLHQNAYIDGPKEPTDLSQFMALILSQFKAAEPKGTTDTEGNVTVSGPGIKVWDSHREQQRTVYPVLLFAFGDTPARRGWALTCGHTGRSGCDKCGVRGVRELNSHKDQDKLTATAFPGYTSECSALLFNGQDWDVQQITLSIQPNPKEDEWEPVLAGLDRVLITDPLHRRRSEAAEIESARARRDYPLPVEARNGGSRCANPHTKEQLWLSKDCVDAWNSRHGAANKKHIHLGSRGINPFQASKLLSYEFQSTFMEPVSHMILNSVFRGFMELICNTTNGIVVNKKSFCLSTALQERMDRFIGRIQLPSAYNRPAPKLQGGVPLSSWLFEESNTFIEVTGAIAFHQVQADVHKVILRMWGHLRTFALYFLHYRPGQHTELQIEAARRHVLQYAALAEKHLKGKLLTVLLHRLYAHLATQIKDSLPGALLREDFGERLVRRTKGRITGHSTKQAARASAALCLTEMGLRLVKNDHPDVDEPLVRIRKVRRSAHADAGDDYGTALHQMKNAFDKDGPQVVKFVDVLSSMEAKAKRRAHQVEGPLGLANVVTAEHVTGKFIYQTGETIHIDDVKAEVYHSDSATIQSGAWVVRTVLGSRAYGRVHCDHFAYIPFRNGKNQNPCVMKIEQILLVRREKMGWPNNEARLAVGILWDNLGVKGGAGLERDYNDDPSLGACCVPRALSATKQKLSMGYPWAVHLRQIHCPCAYIAGETGDTFITISKMGFHGRKDLFLKS